jgi:hypothetical protein
MDIQKMIRELEDERDRLDEAILALERLAATTRARGRPPRWRKELAAKMAGSAETIEAASPRNKKPHDVS